MSIDRRTVLKAALAVVTTAAVGESVAGCDTRRSTAVPAAGTAPTSAAPTPLEGPSVAVISAGPASRSAPPSATTTPTPAGSGNVSSVSPTGRPAKEIVHGPASATGIALTFHGAGDPALGRALLDLAEGAGAHVTVLAVGSWLEANPAMAKRILDGGHDLGNHTYHHLTMPSLGPAADDSEIARCADVLRTLTGSQGRWFRPSGTSRATPTILAAAGRAGYAECLSYDVDPLDYTDPGAASVASRLLGAVVPGSIVSLHFGHKGTVQAMRTILAGLHDRGLPAVSMTSLVAS